MAAPHVAGVAAYLLGLETRYTPAALAARITALASKGLVGSLPTGTKNLLLYNNSGR
jgi:subtilisin family serine protease